VEKTATPVFMQFAQLFFIRTMYNLREEKLSKKAGQKWSPYCQNLKLILFACSLGKFIPFF
jgi:hypothetical protein